MVFLSIVPWCVRETTFLIVQRSTCAHVAKSTNILQSRKPIKTSAFALRWLSLNHKKVIMKCEGENIAIAIPFSIINSSADADRRGKWRIICSIIFSSFLFSRSSYRVSISAAAVRWKRWKELIKFQLAFTFNSIMISGDVFWIFDSSSSRLRFLLMIVLIILARKSQVKLKVKLKYDWWSSWRDLP